MAAPTPLERAYQRAASRLHGIAGTVEFDTLPDVSIEDDISNEAPEKGAWVQAWIWVKCDQLLDTELTP